MTAHPTIRAELLRLMLPPHLPNNARLGPEDQEAIAFTAYMRVVTLEGRYRGVWFHSASEGKRHRMEGARLKAIGMLPGIPDFTLLWVTHLGEMDGGLVELKPCKGGTVRPSQRDFEAWCDATGIRHAICRGAKDAIAVVEEWGAVRAPKVEAA